MDIGGENIATKVKQRLIISGNIWETYDYEIPYFKDYEIKENQRQGKKETTEEQKRENRKRNMHRAKTTVRRLINANADVLTKFVTLTYAKNITDIAWSNNEFKLFIKRLKYYLLAKGKEDLIYIVVIEFQQRGAIHYHFLCNLDYIPNKDLREIWSHGFVKINRIDKVDNLGAYVTKYMTKDIDDERLYTEKSYFTTRDIRKPIEINDLGLIKGLLSQVGAQDKKVYETQFENEHLGKVEYKQYNLNENYILSKNVRQHQHLYT